MRYLVSLMVLLASSASLADNQDFATSLAEPSESYAESEYRAGASQSDITGPIAELGLMGYADVNQKGAGMHMRLRSRALVVSDSSQNTVALVIADLCMVFHELKQAVLDRLDHELPGVFNHNNLLFSATHTHAGPAGFAHHTLYNFTTFGFSPRNFDTIVKGTTESIVKAYHNQRAAQLRLARGDLPGLQFSRSPKAYLKNPASERARYSADHDTEMLMLRADGLDGKPIAAFNWFPVHPVSLPLENKLVSGDNKGLASYFFEKEMGATYRKDDEFVAGFVQANAGDISPYDVFQPQSQAADVWARNEASARAQFEKAYELYQSAGTLLQGPLQVMHRFVHLPNREVPDAYTHAGPKRLCHGALGSSFMAGSPNGRPVNIFPQGKIYGVNWPRFTFVPKEQECHQEKVIFLPTGLAQPHPWTSQTGPFQLVRIGQLGIVATPFEITTMAGRRIREQVASRWLKDGVEVVAISALANDYLHYVTTPEEYTLQEYEGGATLFGPWTLPAYTHIFDELVTAMIDHKNLANDRLPADLTKVPRINVPDVIFDAPPVGKKFGQVKQGPADRYHAGDAIQATFWGAHPNSSIGRASSLLYVEKQETSGAWQPIRYDWDYDTFYQWKRHGLAASEVTITWKTREGVAPGTYRLCHDGHAKKAFTGAIQAYFGCSKPFALQD